MIIAGQSVVTPLDDPVAFEPDWRHKVAAAAASTKTGRIPFALSEDTDVRRYLAHIRHRARYPLKEGEVPAAFDRLPNWRNQSTGWLLEAYLLTTASLDEIAADLGAGADDVAQYERLLFNVRGQDGRVIPGVLTRLRSELPDETDQAGRFQRAALVGGLPVLRQLTQSVAVESQDMLGALVTQELTRRAATGQLSTRDLARLQANALLRERIRKESAESASGLTDGWVFSLKLLGAIAPNIVTPIHTAEGDSATTAVIQGRLRAQQNVQATPVVDDEGRGNEAMTDLLRKHFAPVPE